MPSIDLYRSQIASVMMEAEGAHYLHGSFGNCPGVCNGHPLMDFRTSLPANNYVATANESIRVYAARTHISSPVYCWGRPLHRDVVHLPPVPARTLNSPPLLQEFVEREPANAHRWPRSSQGEHGNLVMGESCEGKRHFDCIGIVNWAIWRIFRTTTIRDIQACRGYAAREARERPESVPTQAQYAAGDILIFNVSHIAFVLNGHEMMEAQGENYGVTRSPFRSGVTNVLRPTSLLLNQIWNVPFH